MNRTIGKLGFFGFILCSALLLVGCVGLQEYERTKETDRKELAALKSSLDAANAKIEELGGKLAVLQAKQESAKAGAELSGAQPQGAGGEASMAAPLPPEGLKVVKLGEDGEHRQARGQEEKGQPRPAAEQAKGDAGKKEAAPKAAASKEQQPPGKAYDAALAAYNAGKYAEARIAFTEFVKANPKHSLADNALYWIGEAYYTEKDYVGAAEAFKEVFERYPLGNKAPDAMLKAAYTQSSLGHDAKAKEYMERLLKTYPGSEAAAIAAKGPANQTKKGKD